MNEWSCRNGKSWFGHSIFEIKEIVKHYFWKGVILS